MPTPTSAEAPGCPGCGRSMRLRKLAGFVDESQAVYYCPKDCDWRIPATRNGQVVGEATNEAIRFARIRAHQVFDAFWVGRGWTRRQAYHWLAETLMLRHAECHISLFSVERCLQVAAAVEVANTLDRAS